MCVSAAMLTFVGCCLSLRVWFKKCYDPDCRSWRSVDHPIPSHVFQAPPVSEATEGVAETADRATLAAAGSRLADEESRV